LRVLLKREAILSRLSILPRPTVHSLHIDDPVF
jgi:hypothetical protein